MTGEIPEGFGIDTHTVGKHASALRVDEPHRENKTVSLLNGIAHNHASVYPFGTEEGIERGEFPLHGEAEHGSGHKEKDEGEISDPCKPMR